MILGQFWTDEDTSDVEQVIELEGWVDVLEPYGEAEVRAAWAVYLVGGPRSQAGRLTRPDAGALALIAAALRRGLDPANPALVCQRAFDPAARKAAEESAAQVARFRAIATRLRGQEAEPL